MPGRCCIACAALTTLPTQVPRRKLSAEHEARRQLFEQAVQADGEVIHAGMSRMPQQPDPVGQPRLYTHKFSHLGQQTGAAA
jgi:hypothetical protein